MTVTIKEAAVAAMRVAVLAVTMITAIFMVPVVMQMAQRFFRGY